MLGICNQPIITHYDNEKRLIDSNHGNMGLYIGVCSPGIGTHNEYNIDSFHGKLYRA